MMARFRRQMALRPVNRIKHIVDSSATLAANTALVIPVIQSRDAPVIGNTAEVETGSKVSGVYFRIEVASNEAIDLGAIPNVYLAIVKNPGNNLSFTGFNNLGINPNKKYVIHQEMVMIENKGQGSNGRTLLNGVVVIPKGYQRNGPSDVLNAVIFCPALNTTVCLQAHYKEFR